MVRFGVVMIALVAVTLALGMSAEAPAQNCAGAGSNFGACPPAPTTSLYDRLGGRHPIRLVVDDFVANVVADNRINARFKNMKFPEVERFKSYLSDQICQATGGPCSYVGGDMKTVHKGMKITDAEWNATVEALTKALDKHKVPAREKNELLAILGPMRGDIVGQ